MKKDLHPKNYRLVVFEDTSNGFRFLTRSTASSTEVVTWEDGSEYPLVHTHISSASHPFYTGQEKLVDIEGRVDKFKARQAAASKHAEAAAKKSTKKPRSKGAAQAQKIGAARPTQRKNPAAKSQPATNQ